MKRTKNLLKAFIEFNAEHGMVSARKKCLLTVSGGMDSIVMCELFKQAKFPFAIAHCNFDLRGEESEGDEKFVRELAEKMKVEIFVKHFDTETHAAKQNISIQMAARELRYTWFEDLRAEHKLNLIATAHHLNDNIETIIYNLIKGTGIRGLRGIPQRNGHIIRPLLFASREEIENFQRENNLAFREDSSNAEDKYSRNKIRHSIIPLMKELNPSLENTFAEKIELFSQLEGMYERQLKQVNKKLFLQRRNDVYIPILQLKKQNNAATLLFEYLKEFGFNTEQVEDMIGSINAEAGKQFLTDKARIIKDRRFFILTALPEKDFTLKLINKTDEQVELGTAKLKMSHLKAEEVKVTADKNVAFLDASKLQFPLTLRHWKQGDYFYPFGMKMKKKKLKKFFVDEKIALNEKENVWVVESEQKIVWVVGYRIDERFRVSEKCEEVLKMQFK